VTCSAIAPQLLFFFLFCNFYRYLQLLPLLATSTVIQELHRYSGTSPSFRLLAANLSLLMTLRLIHYLRSFVIGVLWFLVFPPAFRIPPDTCPDQGSSFLLLLGLVIVLGFAALCDTSFLPANMWR
jgi:hypothetical protein